MSTSTSTADSMKSGHPGWGRSLLIAIAMWKCTLDGSKTRRERAVVRNAGASDLIVTASVRWMRWRVTVFRDDLSDTFLEAFETDRISVTRVDDYETFSVNDARYESCRVYSMCGRSHCVPLSQASSRLVAHETGGARAASCRSQWLLLAVQGCACPSFIHAARKTGAGTHYPCPH